MNAAVALNNTSWTSVILFFFTEEVKKEKRNPALFCLPEKRKKLKFAFAEAS